MRKIGVGERLLYNGLSLIYPVLIIYSYFVFVGKYCIQTQHFHSSFILIWFLIFHLILMFNLIFYMRTLAIDDTGTSNRFKEKQVEKKCITKSYFNPFIYQEIESTKKKIQRKCNYCMIYKPPRAHHCSVCNKCFLKYDHHCKFLGVCIAFYNYKFYYLFLITASLYSTFVNIFLLITLFQRPELSGNIKIHFSITVSVLFIELFLVTRKFIIHFFYISRNETTVESIALDNFYKGDQGCIYIFQEGSLVSEEEIFDRSIMNPYNLGFSENWIQIFGTNWMTAALPISTTPGDGINFPKR